MKAKKYPKFIYQDYCYRISKNNLEILFTFKVEPDIKFSPKLIIKNCPEVKSDQIDNLVFHLGLIEMISYWKATCSPVIEVKAGFLNSEQIKWWQSLIAKGMGQFSYENKMPFQRPTIKTKGKSITRPDLTKLKERVLVPIGGGKDSIVTLETLKKAKKNINCICLNPTETDKRVMKAAGCDKPIIGERKIDKKLLELNQKGFLNGHTPISAYFAFFTTLAAAIFDYKYIALSNERSSNEGNIKYLGKTINHQWSKSFEFEQMFRRYSKKYLVKDVEYFSFLRPLYEIQIAKLFSQYPKYFPVFLSCNEAYKTYSGTRKPFKKWCGKCSKCLFVFTILYPFVGDKLIKVFGKNLFLNKNLLPIMEELIGERGFKPFECVGTQKESLAAFYLSWRRSKEKRGLLKYFEEKILPKHPNLEKESEKILSSWNSQNNLSREFENILEK